MKEKKKEEPRFGWSAGEWPDTPLEPLYREHKRRPKKTKTKLNTDRLKNLGWDEEKGIIH